MDLSELFFGDFSFLIFGVLLTIILLLLAKYIGHYPSPLPRSETPKKEFIEVMVFWGIQLTWLSLYIFVIKPMISNLFFPDFPYYLAITIDSLITFIFPLIYVVRKNNWKLNEIGFTNTIIKSWKALVFSISSYILLGIYSFFRSTHVEVYWWALLLLLYSNAFLEEFFYRGIIQSKLERSFGQKKALLYQGILFTIIHVPGSISRILIYGNLLFFIWNYFFVFLHGIIYGLTYMKTRNLWPSVICHYLTNWAVATILLFI